MTPEELRDSWLCGFNKQDTNSVAYQVAKLVHGAAVYDLLTASRAMMPVKDGQHQINVLVHRMIDDNFWIAQGAGVRKLVDKSPWHYQGTGRDNSVWSLRSLLEDMRKQRAPYFTRGCMLEAEGREYDVHATILRYKSWKEQLRDRSATVFVPREYDAELAAARHCDIDELTGVPPANRNPNDAVDERIFCELINRLVASTEDIVSLANKHMLHAASEQSRFNDEAYSSDMVVTLADLEHAHSVLCRTFRFISEMLLGDGEYDLLPTVHLGMLDNFENSYMVADMKQRLYERWLSLESRIKGYTAWTMEELNASSVLSDGCVKRD